MTIAFPQMGDYGLVAKYFFTHVSSARVMNVPPITQKTVEKGTTVSPDFVCMPFKFTLGTIIECLDQGADVVLQIGGGCRYGYYVDLQTQILKDLGYKFKYINFITMGQTKLLKIYKDLKQLPNFSILKSLKYGLISFQMIKYMDKIDNYIRHNVGFEQEKNSFVNLKKQMLNDFTKITSMRILRKSYKYYVNEFKKLKLRKPDKPLKVGIIGELYTVMEPFANYFLETELAKNNIEITRFTNAHYLLVQKKNKIKYYLKYANEYVKYKMGADASDNIARTKYMCENDYDGIIHIKSSFCTPEIGAMPIISKITEQYKMPIVFFSFDSNTSEAGIKTRLEAFYDMLEMRRK